MVTQSERPRYIDHHRAKSFRETILANRFTITLQKKICRNKIKLQLKVKFSAPRREKATYLYDESRIVIQHGKGSIIKTCITCWVHFPP